MLASLPCRVRDSIYGLHLHVSSPVDNTELDASNDGGSGHHTTALLSASHTIHYDATIMLYKTNKFSFWICRSDDTLNRSIMGQPGFEISVSHHMTKNPPTTAEETVVIPDDMVKHLQFVVVTISSRVGLGRAILCPQ